MAKQPVNVTWNKLHEHFHVLYYNVRSLLPKIDELRAVCETSKPDVICIVETWLDHNITNNELAIQGYQLFRLDRNRHGGGIALYVHLSLSCNILLTGGPFELEFISLSVSSQSSFCKFCICLFYRPPSSSVSIFDNLCTTLQILNPVHFRNFLLLGDFNVDFCNQTSYLYSHVNDIMLNFSLSQIVSSPTRISSSSNSSLIDLAMVSNTDHLNQCTLIPPLSTSDHLGLSITLKWKVHRATASKSRKVWLYKHGNFELACRLINETDWDSILIGNDIDLIAQSWTDKFLTIMEQCIPHRNLRKRCNLPWLTKNIVQLIRKRNILFRRAKRSGKLVHFWQYKSIRNKIICLLRNSKKHHFSKLANASDKEFWKSVRLFNKKQDSIPPLNSNGNIISDDKQKAEILNNFFASCWNSLEQPLTEETYHSFHSLPCEDATVSADQVFHLISSLDTNKASGPDGISGQMLKSTANSISSSLAKLFSLSLAMGKFPKIWKVASVVPVAKSTVTNDPTKYRPISLLSIVSKLLEKIVYSLVWEHISDFFPISDQQWGFQKHKSTTAALLSATSIWFKSLERREDIICVFFDYKKAFDSVPHRMLMECLSHLEFHPLILSWLCSYLSNRQQFVCVSGKHSQSIAVRSGVPQGSVLGPLLFLIYINDITTLNFSSNSRLTLYADDILLYKPIRCKTSYKELQQDIDCLSQWSENHMLSFNIDKCKCMLLSNRQNITPPPLSLNNQSLEFVQEYKYLGVVLTNNLCWSSHIQYISNKARRVLGIIYRNISPNIEDCLTVLKLYMALVRPHLEYAAQIWNPHLVKDIKSLEKIQKFALRICSKNYHETYQNLLSLYQVPTLENRRLFLCLCTFYSIVNKLVFFPEILLPSTMPVTTSRCRNYNPCAYQVPHANLNSLKFSFFVNTVKVWNNLPHEAVTTTDLANFKYLISPLFMST